MFEFSKQAYHTTYTGKTIPFCILLNCFEQPCYFEFRKRSLMDRWIFFCDDINLEINQYRITPYSTGVKDKYQKIDIYVIENEYYDRISELLKHNGALILVTAFNYVMNYWWWGENTKNNEYLHDGHCTYIIGEDNEAYYIADSPNVFVNVEQIQCKNKAIVRIEKRNFLVAFQKYCEVKCVSYHELPSSYSEEKEYFICVLKKICDNYYSDICVGRSALIEMKKMLQTQSKRIFDNIFGFHLMMARRIILRRCINLLCKDIEGQREALYNLDGSIMKWGMIKTLLENGLKDRNNSYRKIQNEFEEIIYIEDLLHQSLSGLASIL